MKMPGFSFYSRKSSTGMWDSDKKVNSKAVLPFLKEEKHPVARILIKNFQPLKKISFPLF
ncbi:hypothetical protein B0E43_09005 [Algoriphagus sp. A40]|nr:hypothetical protein B0E43_09005 [Algoriphagus sp. A40]